MDDDLWWSDEHDVDGKVPRMAKQCHITLIDFGFARALRPDDIDADFGLKKIRDESLLAATQNSNGADKEIFGPCFIDQVLEDTSHVGLESPPGRGQSCTGDDSISRKRVLDLSESSICPLGMILFPCVFST